MKTSLVNTEARMDSGQIWNGAKIKPDMKEMNITDWGQCSGA
jgi:hypothetical protein